MFHQVPLGLFGLIQVLRNALGVGVYGSVQISVTKVYGPTLLAFRGGGGWSNFQKKVCVTTFEFPLTEHEMESLLTYLGGGGDLQSLAKLQPEGVNAPE